MQSINAFWMGNGFNHRKPLAAASRRSSVEGSYLASLQQIHREFEQALQQDHPEPWWQRFIERHSFILLRSYFACLPKLNLAIGQSKIPDFLLVTYQQTLEILEIKSPSTPVMRCDKSRNNYYWSTHINKAIAQISSYEENAHRNTASLHRYLREHYNLEISSNSISGIILVGYSAKSQKEQQEFDRQCSTLTNIRFLTYEQLLTALRQHIFIFENFL
ncbi:MAG: DUF4263 domain-containing protein [Candidatus Pseudobacter hemicellulosilyticus]|uniref:DUF4263 domain-containing protein n=1 Tax=Candidatus Pseudobacter hemicellulosilyticus TaxID=3121375 RepID=A0AAJ5WRE2_9BACT|nr:MAG: DUF4263 domain-containing protein [Pseudobacter sp.]